MIGHRSTGLPECGPTESSAPEPCFYFVFVIKKRLTIGNLFNIVIRTIILTFESVTLNVAPNSNILGKSKHLILLRIFSTFFLYWGVSCFRYVDIVRICLPHAVGLLSTPVFWYVRQSDMINECSTIRCFDFPKHKR